MNLEGEGRQLDTCQTNKDEETICWRRKSSIPRPRSLHVGDAASGTEGNLPLSTGIIKTTSRRKKSSSTNIKIASKQKGSPRNGSPPMESSLNNSEASLGDFVTVSHGNNLWSCRGREHENQEEAPGGSSCDLNDIDGNSGRSNPNAHSINSASSKSLNSDSFGSFVSSTSSGSHEKPPLHTTPRKTHTTRTLELRKQMREFHRFDHHIRISGLKPKKHKSAPRMAAVATSNDVVEDDSKRNGWVKASSQSQIIDGPSTSPIKRSRSLQRRQSLDRPLENTTAIAKKDLDNSSDHGQTNRTKKSPRRPTMRNLLRTRRKLERELNQNEVFHYVLHKRPKDSLHLRRANSARSLEKDITTSSTSNAPGLQYMLSPSIAMDDFSTTGSSKSSITSGKLSLDQFLHMKRQSEHLVESQRDHDKKISPRPEVVLRKNMMASGQASQHENEIWQDSVLGTFLSNHGSPQRSLALTVSDKHPFGRIVPSLGQSLFRLNQLRQDDQQDDTIIDDEGFLDDMLEGGNVDSTIGASTGNEQSNASWDSFISHDRVDLPPAWTNERKRTDEWGLLSSTQKRSQGIALAFDDARMLSDEFCVVSGDDSVSLQNSMGNVSLTQSPSIHLFDSTKFKKEVKDMAMSHHLAGIDGKYSGPISTVTGLPHGIGRLEFPGRGEVFVGQFLHGWWSGFGTCTTINTKEEFRGYCVDFVKDGHGISKYVDGTCFEGFFQKGEICNGKMTYPDSSTYVGSFENQARNGRGVYTFRTGVIFSGNFQEDQFLSGVLMYPNGSRFVGHWKNGVRHGPGKEIRADGHVIRRGVWKVGRWEGGSS